MKKKTKKSKKADKKVWQLVGKSKKPKLTVEKLGTILAEEFKRENWGWIDPASFANPPKNRQGANANDAGLYDVMRRVCTRLNR